MSPLTKILATPLIIHKVYLSEICRVCGTPIFDYLSFEIYFLLYIYIQYISQHLIVQSHIYLYLIYILLSCFSCYRIYSIFLPVLVFIFLLSDLRGICWEHRPNIKKICKEADRIYSHLEQIYHSLNMSGFYMQANRNNTEIHNIIYIMFQIF